MEFEWDERKRARIIRQRGLDFASAYLFFDGRAVIPPAQPARRRGGVEIDGKDRGRKFHPGVVLARRRHSGHFNEAGT